MIVRMPSLVVRPVFAQVADCATGGVNGASGGGTINGSIVNRLGLPRTYRGVSPWFAGDGLNTTSTGDKQWEFTVKLQHGDSSGGGDMADFSTDSQPTVVHFGNSAMTTVEAGYTSQPGTYYTRPGAYDLMGAKQFIRAVCTVAGPGAATATATGNLIDGVVGLAFIGADEEPASTQGKNLLQSLFTTSTTT